MALSINAMLVGSGATPSLFNTEVENFCKKINLNLAGAPRKRCTYIGRYAVSQLLRNDRIVLPAPDYPRIVSVPFHFVSLYEWKLQERYHCTSMRLVLVQWRHYNARVSCRLTGETALSAIENFNTL